MAARTVGAASDPTDVPVSTVSLARSAREVRARPRFCVMILRCCLTQLGLYDRDLLVLLLAQCIYIIYTVYIYVYSTISLLGLGMRASNMTSFADQFIWLK